MLLFCLAVSCICNFVVLRDRDAVENTSLLKGGAGESDACVACVVVLHGLDRCTQRGGLQGWVLGDCCTERSPS
jgi:hypothetical protein